MRLPLFWKILLATLLPVVAFALLGITTNLLAHRAHRVAKQAHYLARQEAEAELGRRLIAMAQTTSALLRVEDVVLMQPGDETSRTYRRLQATLRSVAKRAGARRLYLFDRAHRSLCDTEEGVAIGSPYYHLAVDRQLLGQIFKEGHGSSLLFVGKDGKDYKAGFASLTGEDGRPVAAVGVDGSAETFAHLRRLDVQLQALRKGLFSPLHLGLLAGAGLLLLFLASLLLARSVTRPVRHLMEATAAIGRGELEVPIAVKSRDELGVLANAMNRMRADLAARQEEMQLMLSGIAHEVRNPLGGMELFAGLLADELAEEPERREMVGRIQRELEYLERVVAEFLDYARQSCPELAPFEVSGWLESIVELCRGEAATRGVRLTMATGGPVLAVGDADKLRRAVLNVLRNGIGATPRGGEVALGLEVTAAQIAILCRDSGTGIPPENLDKIFNAFYTTRERGTGLGLAFVQKIVASHGGRIEVDSVPQEGTRIRILLPRGDLHGDAKDAVAGDEAHKTGPCGQETPKDKET